MTKELREYRIQLVNRLAEAAVRFREVCLAVKDPYAALEAGSWSIHQVAVHTRDVHQLVYGVRARRTAEEDNPEFPNFDSDAYMAEYYDKNEPLKDLLDRFVDDAESFTAMLRGLPAEAWSRESRHAIMGSGFTLQTWVERGLAHIEEHIETVRSAR
jgi:hypothetical protein